MITREKDCISYASFCDFLGENIRNVQRDRVRSAVFATAVTCAMCDLRNVSFCGTLCVLLGFCPRNGCTRALSNVCRLVS